MREPARPATLDVFLVAGEESGDQLGADLMRALRQRTGGKVRFAGVGGRAMAAEGVASLYSIDDLAMIGFMSIPRRAPGVVRRLRLTARSRRGGAAARARHHRQPGLHPWESRDGCAPPIPRSRSSNMSRRRYGPGGRGARGSFAAISTTSSRCCRSSPRSISGSAARLAPMSAIRWRGAWQSCVRTRRRRSGGSQTPPVLLVLPGSRRGEIQRLLGIFAETVALVTREIGAVEVVIPAVAHLVDTIRGATAHWPVRPRIVVEAADKDAAFRVARAALAKSGTVTLELALAGVPMVAAYKITPIEYLLVGRGIQKRLSSVILANLVLGETVVPQFLQHDCTAERLAAALLPLIGDGAERQRQIEAFSRLDAVMGIGKLAPAACAADIVLGLARGGVPGRERADV